MTTFDERTASSRETPAPGFFDPPVPRLIAHRGASGTHPENTLPAFEQAVADGAEMIELDVHLSADAVPVVIHDATLERTTGEHGLVADRTADELARVDAGFRFSPDRGRTFPFRGRGGGVPSLAGVLSAFPTIRFTLEVKTPDPALDAPLASVLEGARAAPRVLLASQYGEVVRRLRRTFAGLATNFGSDEVAAFMQAGARAVPPGARALQVPPRHGLRKIVSRAFVEEAHRAGIEVQVWTVNDPARMRALLDIGVDGIMTDFPSRLLQVYRARGAR